MRTILHLSDLHFGRHDVDLVEAIGRLMRASPPDLIVISGDLTQRARTREFKLAQAFVQNLPVPTLVVPGNHDVPLYDVSARWLSPLVRFRRFISADLQPSFVDDQIAVVGINTARSLTWKNGRINERQIQQCCETFSAAPASAARIIVTHHPFDVPVAAGSEAIIGRAAMAITRFSKCRVDLILSGHFHVRHTGTSATRYKAAGRPILLFHAGTAISTRRRGERNSLNRLRIEKDSIAVDCLAWDADAHAFGVTDSQVFEREP